MLPWHSQLVTPGWQVQPGTRNLLTDTLVQNPQDRFFRAKPPTPRSHLYLVLATDDLFPKKSGLSDGQDFAANKELMRRLFMANVASDNLTIVTFAPQQKPNRDNVLKTIAQLNIRPYDTLIVYYAGHGSYTDDLGHYLTFWDAGSSGHKYVTRRELVESIGSQEPRLGVLITDTCYTYAAPHPRIIPGPITERLVVTQQTNPLFYRLFFASSGFADVTSSQRGQASWTYPKDERGRSQGGFFTVALTSTLERNRNRNESWDDVFRMIQIETRDIAARHRKVQIPSYWRLPNSGISWLNPFTQMRLARSQVAQGTKRRGQNGTGRQVQLLAASDVLTRIPRTRSHRGPTN